MASAGEGLYAGNQRKQLTSPKNQAIIVGLEPIGPGSGPGVLPRLRSRRALRFIGQKNQRGPMRDQYSVLQPMTD